MNPTVKLDRFRDKIAVVTGGAQGIGRATVERMALEGGKVFIVDRAEDAARATAKALRADGLDVDVAIADMATWAGASKVIDDIVALAGRIDVLVNNVGGTIWIKPFVEYTEDEIKAEMDRSLWPTIWACRAVIPHMIARKSGSIVNVGSNSVRGIYRIPYATAKGGVMAITTSLAIELAESGVRINCVAPGGTDISDRATPRNASPASAQETVWANEMRQFVHHQMHMHRRGRVEEQASAIAFMASDDASFITGQILSVAGGASV
jgi:dihydroxycyclohexadiene carboxylate dehydrogenase